MIKKYLLLSLLCLLAAQLSFTKSFMSNLAMHTLATPYLMRAAVLGCAGYSFYCWFERAKIYENRTREPLPPMFPQPADITTSISVDNDYQKDGDQKSRYAVLALCAPHARLNSFTFKV